MHIIIEGPDATGKSTLANKLGWVLNRPVISSAGPPQTPQEMVDRVDGYLAMALPAVFDRHPCVSDIIYGKHRGGSPIRGRQLEQFYNQNYFFIYAPYNGQLQHEEKSHDSRDHLDLITRHEQAILADYAKWAFVHAHVIYRYEESEWLWEPLMEAIKQQLEGEFAYDYC